MTGERAARRYPAPAFPEIRAVRLAPIGATATLVNLSATGILVECDSRPVPGTPITVQFDGTFRPASVESRVIRCEVTGISPDGSLRFRIGLAFDAPIEFHVHREPGATDEPPLEPEPPRSPAVPASPAGAAPAKSAARIASARAPVPRNRW